MDERATMAASAGGRLAVIKDSFERVTGEKLVAAGCELWSARRVVVAHGTERPPLFFYANRAGLDLFRMTAEDFIGLPSYRSAEEAWRGEREAMLARLEEADVVTEYAGIRVAADGTRFKVEDAIVWNLRDSGGTLHGQAATIGHWSLI
jgi:hypothetical protein